MKKMRLQTRCILAGCFLSLFLFSCKDSTPTEKLNLSVKDSSNKSLKDAGTLANIVKPIESSCPDSCSTTFEQRFRSVSEVNKRLNKKPSCFVIKTNRDTVIKCKQGTLLSIPANAFVNASDQNRIVGEVKIMVKEFYKISDMMIQGLTTTSNNRLLETGGMINIKVTSKENNDSCILKTGKTITIALANSDTTSFDRMQLFNGVHDSTHLNWAPRGGIAGFAQSWRFGRTNSVANIAPLNVGLVFQDEKMKVKPAVINTNAENFQTEIKLPLRDLLQDIGMMTKKANAYIDTIGNLQCYKIGSTLQQITFHQIYGPTSIQDVKVNLAVDVNLNYTSTLNHEYYQKLFKMRKANPDSLVTVTVTLNPTAKLTGYEKIKTHYKDVLTLKQFKRNQRIRELLVQAYENKLKKLRLKDEENLINAETKAGTNLQSAQNYLLLSTPNIGWINCDRFYDAPAKVDYLVKLNEPASLLIVFNSIKAIMSSDRNGLFQGVPLNEKITIVGLKTVNGQLMMAYHQTTVTDQPFEKLSFVPVTIKEYKSRLENLNRL